MMNTIRSLFFLFLLIIASAPVNAITLSTSEIRSIDVQAISSNEVVVAYCVYSITGSSMKFRTYYSNGTAQIAEQTALAASASVNCDSTVTTVSVSPLSNNTFVLGYTDGSRNVYARSYYKNGTAISAAITVETSATNIPAYVQVDALSATDFAIIYGFNNVGIKIGVYNTTGSTLTSPFSVDSSYGYGGSISALDAVNLSWASVNVTHYRYGIVNRTSTSIVAAVNVYNRTATQWTAWTEALSGYLTAYGIYDYTAGDVLLTVYNQSGGTSIKNFTIDSDVGTVSSPRPHIPKPIGINSTHFGVLYRDTTSDTGLQLMTFLNNGSNTSGVVSLISATTLSYFAAPRNHLNVAGTTLCDNVIALGWVGSTSATYLEFYYPNGTAFGGTCASPPASVLMFSLTLPGSSAINASDVVTWQEAATATAYADTGVWGGTQLSAYLYYNFSTTAANSGATLQTKHGVLDTYNTTVPTQCYNSTLIQIRGATSVATGFNSWSFFQCKNSSGSWVGLGSVENASAGASGGASTQSPPTSFDDGNYSTANFWDYNAWRVKTDSISCTITNCNKSYVYDAAMYWSGSASNELVFNFTRNIETQVQPCVSGGSCQNSTVPIFLYVNVGNIAINLNISMDSLTNGITMKAYTSNDYASAQVFNSTANYNFATNLGVNANTSLWLWADGTGLTTTSGYTNSSAANISHVGFS